MREHVRLKQCDGVARENVDRNSVTRPEFRSEEKKYNAW